MSQPPPDLLDPSIVEVEFVVEPNYAGWRLDRYLCQKIRRLSRTRVKSIIEKDLVADRRLKPSSLVTPGLTFKLRKRVMEEPDAPRTFGDLYLDEHLFILDKPAGLPIHPTARYHRNTLVSLLQERFTEAGEQPHPAHRLDRETSGIVVCGRTTEASRRLMRQFVRGEVQKEYLAICEGSPEHDAFEVDAPIAEGGETVRISVRIDEKLGKPARTEFEVLRRFERQGELFSLVRCKPKTGRQHQIRVHLRHVGFPLVGDKIYGPDEGYFDRFSKHQLEPEAWVRLRLPRQALHAAKVRFKHPILGTELEVESPLPQDLSEFLSEPADISQACASTRTA